MVTLEAAINLAKEEQAAGFIIEYHVGSENGGQKHLDVRTDQGWSRWWPVEVAYDPAETF